MEMLPQAPHSSEVRSSSSRTFLTTTDLPLSELLVLQVFLACDHVQLTKSTILYYI